MSLNLDSLLYELDDQIPIAQAIELIVKIKKMKLFDPENVKQKNFTVPSILIGGLLLIAGLFFKERRKKQRILQKASQILIQEPLDASLIKTLVERWNLGIQRYDYDTFDILENQWDGVSVMRNIFVNPPPPSTIYNLANPSVYIPFSDYKSLKSLESLRYSPLLTNLRISLSDLRECVGIRDQKHRIFQIKSILPVGTIDKSSMEIPHGFFNILHSILGLLIREITIMTGMGDIPSGPMVKLGEAGIFIRPTTTLCIFGDIVFHKGQLRFANIKWIGDKFNTLQDYMMSHYDRKIQMCNRNMFGLLILGVLIVGLFVRHRLKQSLIHDWVVDIEQKFPRIMEVRKKLDKVYVVKRPQQDSLKCSQCDVNFIDYILIPCYHLQVCRSCFQTNKQNHCRICQKEVFCGIPIYFA